MNPFDALRWLTDLAASIDEIEAHIAAIDAQLEVAATAKAYNDLHAQRWTHIQHVRHQRALLAKGKTRFHHKFGDAKQTARTHVAMTLRELLEEVIFDNALDSPLVTYPRHVIHTRTVAEWMEGYLDTVKRLPGAESLVSTN